MTPILISAIVTITLALIFYTVGVWAEHSKKELKLWHTVCFWIGLCFDTTGTALMSRMSESSGLNSMLSAHGITGVIAIVLMIVHAVWATIVLAKKNESSIKTFHKFSIVVWLIWLVPYILGMMMGMGK